jgi:hypothetical protein
MTAILHGNKFKERIERQSEAKENSGERKVVELFKKARRCRISCLALSPSDLTVLNRKMVFEH